MDVVAEELDDEEEDEAFSLRLMRVVGMFFLTKAFLLYVELV